MNYRIKSSKKIDSNTDKLVKEAHNRCHNFFNFELDKEIEIIICHTKKEFKVESKYYYVPYATALVLRSMNIVIKSPDLIQTEGKWEKKDFVNILSHEMAHSFYYNKLKVWTPNWISEGIACNIGKQFLLNKSELKKLLSKKFVNFKFIDFRYLPNKIGVHTIERYQIWSNFTDYLIKTYGKTNLLKFLGKYSQNPTKDNYLKIFESIYKSKVKNLYEDFINSI